MGLLVPIHNKLSHDLIIRLTIQIGTQDERGVSESSVKTTVTDSLTHWTIYTHEICLAA